MDWYKLMSKSNLDYEWELGWGGWIHLWRLLQTTISWCCCRGKCQLEFVKIMLMLVEQFLIHWMLPVVLTHDDQFLTWIRSEWMFHLQDDPDKQRTSDSSPGPRRIQDLDTCSPPWGRGISLMIRHMEWLEPATHTPRIWRIFFEK